jgi:hypothetical protein
MLFAASKYEFTVPLHQQDIESNLKRTDGERWGSFTIHTIVNNTSFCIRTTGKKSVTGQIIGNWNDQSIISYQIGVNIDVLIVPVSFIFISLMMISFADTNQGEFALTLGLIEILLILVTIAAIVYTKRVLRRHFAHLLMYG